MRSAPAYFCFANGEYKLDYTRLGIRAGLVWRSASPSLLGGSRRRRFQAAKYTRNVERSHGEHGAGSKAHEVSLSSS
jgi:hypothetical protein